MRSKSIIEEKSLVFASRIIKAFRFLKEQKGEHVMSKQLLRSGTAIGALIREAEFAESKKDFIHIASRISLYKRYNFPIRTNGLH